jgi:Protein of unknown function (DUF1302)
MGTLSNQSNRNTAFRRRSASIAIASLLAVAGGAQGFEVPTGNDDLAIRWDNTIRYNAGVRAQGQNSAILGNTNLDDGDRNFSNGSLVTNRVDDLTEFDLVWQRKYGVRFSAALWYDAAYNNLDNTNTATANTLVDHLPVAGQLSPYTKRYANGFSGEWLDAFAFGNFDIGDVPVSIKAGQHTVYWGDSLLLGGAVHGISYAQNSLDLWKAFATPGAEAKELFRPRGGLTIQAQPTKDLSIAGQWFYNWQAVRVPESGSYLTINDGLQFGGDSAIVAPNPFAAAIPGAPAYLRAWNTSPIPPSRYSGSIGDWGISARWSPEWLDGTLGFYGRNATDILPQQYLTPGLATGVPAAKCTAIGGIVVAPGACIVNKDATTVADLTKYGKYGTYGLAYGNDIHIFGVSLSKEVEGVSMGAEVSYRQNMPLVSSTVAVLPAPLVNPAAGQIATTALPSNGDTPGARGDTFHGLVNAVNIFPKTPVFDTATLSGELTFMRWLSVTQNEAAFKGSASYVNPDGSTPIDKVTRNYVGLGINFSPTWFQVFPGVDLSAPVAWSQGLSGNAAVLLGGTEGAGTYSVGVAADIYQKYKVSLQYIGYYGNFSTNPVTGALVLANGTNASLSDRGWVSLTLKATF